MAISSTYEGLDDLIHYRQDCWCARSWCPGNIVDAEQASHPDL